MSVKDKTLTILLFSSALLFSNACSPVVQVDDGGRDADVPGDGDSDSDADVDIDDGDVLIPDGGLAPRALTAVQPNHGPFAGGAEVLLRGRGFVEGVEVHFGERLVDPADVSFVDGNRVRVVTPPGEPGSVDVTMKLPEGEVLTLEGGYTYDSWYLDPSSGSIGGGTLVRLIGMRAELDPESVITFNGVEASDIVWINSDEMTCRTPPGTMGGADVAVIDSEGVTAIHDGFTYYDNADPRNGGLGGGPIEGTIDVTVLDGATRRALPDSFVILGTDPETPFQGRTDFNGRITFSDPSLRGRQTITASHAPIEVFDDDGDSLGEMLYESTTIVEFDASSVTILLEPIPPPQPGSPPTGRRGGFIEGELLFEHRGEFGPYEWEIVPEPGPEEVKVAFVYTTQATIRSGRMEPGVDGIVFNSPAFIGVNGYRFRIYATPGTVAVYAFAGIARRVDPAQPALGLTDFVPYAMGVARGVVVGPEETVTGVNVLMTRQMHRNIVVELENAPLADETGTPNTYIVDVFLDLGAEGVISRPETQRRTSNPFAPYSFPGWVDLTGNIAGASYTVVAGAWTTRAGSEEEQNPWSVVYRTGLRDIETPIVIDELLGIPRASSPRPGEVVVGDRMEWTDEGVNTPDFSIATLSIPGGIQPLPFWLVVLRGGETTFELPNLPELTEDTPEYPRSNLNWQVWSFSVEEGFEFDSWSYRYLVSRYWSAYAVDSWYIRLRD